MYGVYDTENNDICIGVFDNIRDIAKYFNKPWQLIYQEIRGHHKRNWRYDIIKIDDEYIGEEIEADNTTLKEIVKNQKEKLDRIEEYIEFLDNHYNRDIKPNYKGLLEIIKSKPITEWEE